MSKIINLALYTALFLLFCFLPSIVVPGLKDPTQTGKFFVFSYFCALVLLLYLVRRIAEVPALVIKTPDILLMILLVFIIINRRYFQPTYNFSMRYYELLGLVIIYVVLRSIPSKIYFILLLAVISGGILQAILGSLQLFGFYPSNNNNFPITGSFFNPGPYAGYLASVFPATVGCYLLKANFFVNKHNPDKKVKAHLYNALGFVLAGIPILGAALILLVIGATQSRAAWISIIVIAFAFILMCYHSSFLTLLHGYFNTNKKRTAVIIVFSLITLAGITSIYNLKKDSADGRILIWKIAGKMITDQPLTGIGIDRFKTVYMNYQGNYLKNNKNIQDQDLADDVNYAFNEPLQFVVENGLLEGVMVLLLLIILFNSKTEGADILMFTAKAGLASVLIFSLFSYPAQILPVKLNAVLYLTYLGKTGKPIMIFSGNKLGYKIFRSLTTLILIGTFVTGWFTNTGLKKLYTAFEDWSKASAIYIQGDYPGSIVYYEKAYGMLNKDGEFLLQYGKALEMCKEYKKALMILLEAQRRYNTVPTQVALGNCYCASGNYHLAENAYTTASAMTPAKFYPQYLLAKMYNEDGQHDKAVIIAHSLIRKKVKISSDAIDDIILEMQAIIDQKSLP